MTRYANLLPLAFRRRMLWRIRLRQWAAVWLAVLLLAGGSCWWKQRSLDAGRAQLREIERRAAPLAALERQNRGLRARLDALAGRQSLLTTLEPLVQPLQFVGAVSHSARAGGARVQVRRFALVPIDTAASPPPARGAARATQGPPAAPRNPAVQLSLTGIAIDELAIAEFVAALRSTGLFRSVELQSAANAGAAGEARDYTVECVFQGDDET